MVEARQHLDPTFLITALFIITLIGRNSVISSVAIVSVEAFIFSIVMTLWMNVMLRPLNAAIREMDPQMWVIHH